MPAGVGRRVRGRLAPEAMFPAGEPAIRARRVVLPSGIALRLAESGDAGNPPVVLLHGWGASVYMWRAWFAPLADAGYHVVAVDLPGHGLSDKPDIPGIWTLAGQVALLRSLFDAERLAGVPVIAQSMAGTIALELALERRSAVSHLILVNPAAFGRAPLQRITQHLPPRLGDLLQGGAVPRWFVARAHRTVYADPSRITSRDVDEYWAPSQFPGYARAMRRLLHDFEWNRQPADAMAEQLGTLDRAPLAIISGADRLVRDAGPYVAAMRRAGAPLELLELPHSGHAVNEEEPALLIPRVLEYLR